MAAKSLALNLSEEAYESNDDSLGSLDVNSKMTPVKAKTLAEDHDPPGSEYEERTHLHESNIYDDATDKVIPTTVPPASTKTSTKDVLSPKKVKKSKISKPNFSDAPDPTKKPIPSSISIPPPASKRLAKVTDIDYLADLAYDSSTVIRPRDAAKNDDLFQPFKSKTREQGSKKKTRKEVEEVGDDKRERKN